MQKKHTLSILIVLLFFILSCGISGSRQPAAPPHEGIFIQADGELVELYQSEGPPYGSARDKLPTFSGGQFTFTAWLPEVQWSYFSLYQMVTNATFSYDVTPRENDIYEIVVRDTLPEGRFCFVQGNPLLSFVSLPHWCFSVGESSAGDSQDGNNQEVQILPSATQPPTADPKAIQTQAAQALTDVDQAANAATVAAAENILKTATSIAQGQLATAAAATQIAQKQIDDECRALLGQLRDGDYSGLTPGVSLNGCSFRKFDFFGLDLSNASFKGAELVEISFKNANLQGADFSGSIITGSDFTGADLTGAKFAGAILKSSFFGHGTPDESVFAEAIFDFSPNPEISESGLQLRWSQNNVSMVVADTYGHISLYDLKTGLVRSNEFGLASGSGFKSVAISPDGASLIYKGNADGGVNLVAFDIDDPDRITAIPFPVSEIQTLLWHPNGHQVLAVSRNELILADMQTGKIQRNYLGYDDISGGDMFAWSPGGDRFAIANHVPFGSSQLWVYGPANGGGNMIKDFAQGEEFGSVKWSPDETKLAFLYGGPYTGKIEIIDAVTGQASAYHDSNNYSDIEWLDSGHYVVVNSGDHVVQLYEVGNTSPAYSSDFPEHLNLSSVSVVSSPAKDRLAFLKSSGEVIVLPMRWLFPNFAITTAHVPPAPAPTAPESSGIGGTWNGTYTYSQGLTNLALEISDTGSSNISAIFRFSAHESNPTVPSGSFRMAGTYNRDSGEIILLAVDWIERPSGFVTTDLSGTVSQDETRMTGNLQTQGCSTFTLEKD